MTQECAQAWRAAAEAFEPLVHDCEDGIEGEHTSEVCKLSLKAHVLLAVARQLETE